jgi:hypothetical protein
MRAKFFEAFLLSGSPSGHMAHGTWRRLGGLEFLEPIDEDEDLEEKDSNFF